MKPTRLWFAALAVLASFLAAVPTDARPAPVGPPSPSDLENLNSLNPLRRLENLIDLNVPDRGPRPDHLLDLKMLPSPSPQEVEVVHSGLGSGAGEESSHPRPWDGAPPAIIHPQSADAAHQFGAIQRAAEKRPMSFPDGTSLADHDQGGHSNSPAAAYPTWDTSLLHLATHGHRSARNKRPMALGNSPVPTNDELEAAEAVLQLRAPQHAAEERPMSFPDGTWLAHHNRGDHSNFAAAAYPTADTPLAYWATHGRRAARGKRPMALGNSPVPTYDELEADKRLNIASTRNDEGSNAVRSGPNAAMKKGVYGQIRWGDDQLAEDLLNAIHHQVGSNFLFFSANSFPKHEVEAVKGRIGNNFSDLTSHTGDPRRIFVTNARQGYVIVLTPRNADKGSHERAFTAIAFRAEGYLRGVKDRTMLGEIVVPESTANALRHVHGKKLSEALADASA